MRMKLFFITLALALGAGWSACDSKKEDVKPSSSFTFKLDKDVYQSNATEAYVTDTIYKGVKTLVVDGVTNNFGYHMELMISFPDSPRVGTFTDTEMSLMSIQQKGTGYVGKNIKVNITSINSKHAEGTFSGVLTNGDIEKPLTDGTFKVEIY
ncbi:hypothetical protein ACTJJ0_07655 [Chitinophaga sp. 22321]|uniref:Lipoprotein n=1 Tax=Chitinophaga hostae TaxID=2831022 RepID=A0ABS5IVH5_9BACT|nr:hypothetical protein [Chitinophaga hostae]MBS0026232.1 hypothetical protein [Chitinophaga hostae]